MQDEQNTKVSILRIAITIILVIAVGLVFLLISGFLKLSIGAGSFMSMVNTKSGQYKNQISKLPVIDQETFKTESIKISGYFYANIFGLDPKQRVFLLDEIIQTSVGGGAMGLSGDNIKDKNHIVYKQNDYFKTLNKTYYSKSVGKEIGRDDCIYVVENEQMKLIEIPGNDGCTDVALGAHYEYVASNKVNKFIVTSGYDTFIVNEDGSVYYWNGEDFK